MPSDRDFDDLGWEASDLEGSDWMPGQLRPSLVVLARCCPSIFLLVGGLEHLWFSKIFSHILDIIPTPIFSERYPPVICYIAVENHHVKWENPLFLWLFSIISNVIVIKPEDRLKPSTSLWALNPRSVEDLLSYNFESPFLPSGGRLTALRQMLQALGRAVVSLGFRRLRAPRKVMTCIPTRRYIMILYVYVYIYIYVI